jgi:para-aminobenzoate synthetase/4-amino-4-deoxychorismate lyase
MIVDLVRNDLARVAIPRTVKVTDLFRVERYETVHQLTSQVTARLRPDTGLTQVFRALFPCGSITGAPKASTMKLIRDVEKDARGIYCGAIGYVAPPGHGPRARFSVAIRTAVVDRDLGITTYGTGGGITWASTTEAEYRELLAKTAVLHVDPQEFHLIETMRVRSGHIRWEQEHLARLGRSARYFGFQFDQTAAQSILAARTRHLNEDAIVRLRWYRDGSCTVELVEFVPADRHHPVRLAIDREPIDSRQCWPQHKTSLRLPYTARLARHCDVDDVLLLNEREEVTESCTANVTVRLQGRWWTPPLDSGCLPGVGRARLLATGRIRERVIDADDVHLAEEIALISSVRGWRPARIVDPANPESSSHQWTPPILAQPRETHRTVEMAKSNN